MPWCHLTKALGQGHLLQKINRPMSLLPRGSTETNETSLAASSAHLEPHFGQAVGSVLLLCPGTGTGDPCQTPDWPEIPVVVDGVP